MPPAIGQRPPRGLADLPQQADGHADEVLEVHQVELVLGLLVALEDARQARAVFGVVRAILGGMALLLEAGEGGGEVHQVELLVLGPVLGGLGHEQGQARMHVQDPGLGRQPEGFGDIRGPGGSRGSGRCPPRRLGAALPA